MHRSVPNSAVLKTAIKFQCAQGISGLRPTVSLPFRIRGVLEIRVVEVDVTVSMGCRRQDDHSPIGGKLRYESVDQHEVSEMVGAELQLKTIFRGGLRARHNARIGDEYVNLLTGGLESIGEFPNGGQRCKVCFE